MRALDLIRAKVAETQRRLEARRVSDKERILAVENHFRKFIGAKEAAYKLVHRRPSVAMVPGAMIRCRYPMHTIGHERQLLCG